jgi:hypothetical protein
MQEADLRETAFPAWTMPSSPGWSPSRPQEVPRRREAGRGEGVAPRGPAARGAGGWQLPRPGRGRGGSQAATARRPANV